MDGLLFATQFLHIAGGAAWLGGSIFMNVIVLRFITGQPVRRQRALLTALVVGPERVMIGAALVAASTGLIRGIAFGPITSLGALGTPYGLLWMGAIVATLAVFTVGGTITSPTARRLRDEDGLWTDEGTGEAHRTAVIGHLRLGFRLELAGIALILALMALLPTAAQ